MLVAWAWFSVRMTRVRTSTMSVCRPSPPYVILLFVIKHKGDLHPLEVVGRASYAQLQVGENYS